VKPLNYFDLCGSDGFETSSEKSTHSLCFSGATKMPTIILSEYQRVAQSRKKQMCKLNFQYREHESEWTN
jgi:hypothetical protein